MQLVLGSVQEWGQVWDPVREPVWVLAWEPKLEKPWALSMALL